MGDKLIVIQTSDQRYMMTKYGQDLVEIDTTFNMIRDGEKLWSWVVVDANYNAFAVAWVILESESSPELIKATNILSHSNEGSMAY